MLDFDSMSGLKILRVPIKGKKVKVPDNNLTPCKLFILRLNSYHIVLRLILITCQKRAVNSLLETAGEL